MAGLRTTRIFADTIRRDVCKHPKCRRPLWFAVNVRTGNEMPFVGEPAALEKQAELDTGRDVWTVDLALNHFADCPGAAGFRRAR